MPLVLNEIARRSMSPQMFFANWSNRRNRSPARNPAILSEACSPPWRAWISSLTFQAARRTLSTVWRNSCSVAASGAGSNWNRCTSRLSSDVKRLVSADKVDGTVVMSGNNTSFPHIVACVAWSWPYWMGERSDASNEMQRSGDLVIGTSGKPKPLKHRGHEEPRGNREIGPSRDRFIGSETAN